MTIGIIGFGKFAKLILQVIKVKDSAIQFKIFSRSQPIDNITFFDLAEIKNCDIVIPSTPINAFEETIKQIAPLLSDKCIVVDVCSIKVYPKQVMLKYLPQSVQIIATHPMFGPESYKQNNNSFKAFNLVIDKIRCSNETYETIIAFLKQLEINIVEMSCEEHDKLAAVFHFTTMFIGQIVKGSQVQRTKIDTYSALRMHDFAEIVGDDIEILQDMFRYNPYCKEQFIKIDESYEKLVNIISK